jgi:hypothetical protein
MDVIEKTEKANEEPDTERESETRERRIQSQSEEQRQVIRDA